MKARYVIPYNLYTSPWNVRTKLKDEKTGVGSDKKFTIRGIFTCGLSILGYIFLVMNSGLSKILSPFSGSWLGTILFTIGYAGFGYFSLREISIPEQWGYNVFKPLLRYLNNYHRLELPTTADSYYLNGTRITGMIEPTDDGYLRFTDGSYGAVFKIVGSASNNAFSVDRAASIDSFSNFLRTLPLNTTIGFITNAGGQKVTMQMDHLLDVYAHEKDLLILQYINEEIHELGDYVQGKFYSLHQYMLIRGDDYNALKNAIEQIQLYIDQDKGQIINYYQTPSPDELYHLCQQIYTGLEFTSNHRFDEFAKKEYMKDGHYQKSEAALAGSLKPDDVENGKKLSVGSRRRRIALKTRENTGSLKPRTTRPIRRRRVRRIRRK